MVTPAESIHGEGATLSPLDYLKSLDTEPGIERMWEHFFKLSAIPRSSGHEEKAGEYVLQMAREKRYLYEVDSAGNVLVIKAASPGLENKPGLIFQGHLDMKCKGSPNPAVYGVKPVVKGDWVETEGTTLGADNGIGVSAMLSLMDEDMLSPSIAFMFTVNEEEGLIGSKNMDFKTDLSNFRYLFNTDHEPKEDDREAIISSAGAGDTSIFLPIEWEKISDRKIYKIELAGLMSGHSGLDIGENRLNAIKVLSQVLSGLKQGDNPLKYNLVHVSGGTARNSIPDTAEAYIAIEDDDIKQVQNRLNKLKELVLDGAKEEEKKMKLEIRETDTLSDKMMTDQSLTSTLNLLQVIPDGVFQRSVKIPGHVEYSSNMGMLRTEKDQIEVSLMTRGTLLSKLKEYMMSIKGIAEKHHANVEMKEPYGGWQANPEAEINSIAGRAWEQVSDSELLFMPVHAGLDCGVIVSKYPFFQAISFGPILLNAHTESERVNIPSTHHFYRFLQAIIKQSAEEEDLPSQSS